MSIFVWTQPSGFLLPLNCKAIPQNKLRIACHPVSDDLP